MSGIVPMKPHLMKPYAHYLLLGVPVVGNPLQFAKRAGRSPERPDCRHCQHLRRAIRTGPCYPDEAASAAAAGPSTSSTARPASSRTGTPSEAALSSLEPGLSPATTKLVFLDTEPDTFPPLASMASAASSLV